MSDTTRNTPACDLSGIREAVCVHTDKITDSCLAKDCIEDLHVYLTVESQCTLDKAVSAKARFVELMHVAIQTDPVPYSAGYYTVDITYYYRVIADAVMQAGRPCTITPRALRRRDDRENLLQPQLQKLPVQKELTGSERSRGHRRGRRPDDSWLSRTGGLRLQLLHKRHAPDPAGDSRLLRRRACTRRRVQAPACDRRPVLHCAARAQHTAAHPELRLLHPEQKLPERLRRGGRKSLRGLQPDRFPDGRIFPRKE